MACALQHAIANMPKRVGCLFFLSSFLLILSALFWLGDSEEGGKDADEGAQKKKEDKNKGKKMKKNNNKINKDRKKNLKTGRKTQ